MFDVMRKHPGGVVLLCAAAGVCGWLSTFPGYFSSDELQWGAFGNVPFTALPWVSFLDFGVFQYRPLTFNLWLGISHFLFERPPLFHALWVLLGVGNAGLLHALLRSAEVTRATSLKAAAAFLLVPYSVYVHAWVATLADLLWVAAGLVLFRMVLTSASGRRAFMAGSLCTLTALTAKESAVVLPLLLATAGLMFGARKRFAAAAAGSLLPVVLYLLVRLAVLMNTSAESTGYDLALANAPLQFVTYHIFPFVSALFEVGTLDRWPAAKFAAIGLTVLALMVVGFRMLPRAWLLPLLSACALGPVLLLEHQANQYAYALGAVFTACGALAWERHSRRPGKIALTLMLVLSSAHGLNIAQEMHRVATIQSRFSADLAAALDRPEIERMAVAPRCAKDVWIYRRLTSSIPSYRNVPIGVRVVLQTTVEPGVYPIECEGSITAADPATDNPGNR